MKEATRQQLFGNQRGTAQVVNSPVFERLHEDWAYGFGNWLECPSATEAGSFDCGAGHRNSCPGAYGAYPFIDFDSGYFGILARQGDLATFHEGVRQFRAVEGMARKWAMRQCGP